MKNRVMSFLCVGVLCCCDVERADGESVESGAVQRFESTVQKAIQGQRSDSELVAEAWSATLGMGSDEERFYRAASVVIFLRSGVATNENDKEIASHAKEALKSQQCGRDAAPLAEIIFLVEGTGAEILVAEFYYTLNKAAKLAVLGRLKEAKGGAYSAAPFTKPGQTVEDALGGER